MLNDVGLFFSFFFAFLGLSALANPKEWADLFADLFKRSYAGLLLSFFLLPVGMVILSFHNNWESGFPLFITVAGWLSTVMGFLCLLVPALPVKGIEAWCRRPRWVAVTGALMAVFSLLSALSFYW